MAATKRRSFVIYFLVVLFAVTAIVAYSPQDLGAKAAGAHIVVVDPGRGFDNGSVDPGTIMGGTIESNLNLALSAAIVAQLNTAGYDVYVTRATPGVPANRVLLTGSYSVLDRVKAANAKGADIFISVHMNAYLSVFNSASGANVWYDGAQPGYIKSKSLATSIYNSISTLPGVKGNRTSPVDNYSEIVLKNSNCPAVMLEAGFMTNQADLNRLRDSSQMNTLGAQVSNGIGQYLNLNGSGSNPVSSPDTTRPVCTSVTTSETYTADPEFTVIASNVRDQSGIMDVYFKVFPGSKLSIAQTVEADQIGATDWEADFNVEDLFDKPTGVITIYAYAEDFAGNIAKIGQTAVTYTPDRKAPRMSGVKVTGNARIKSRYLLTAIGVTDPAGVKSVKYVVYPRGKKSMKKTVVPSPRKGNKWSRVFDLKKLFKGKRGRFVVEIWGTDKLGNTGIMGRRVLKY